MCAAELLWEFHIPLSKHSFHLPRGARELGGGREPVLREDG